MEIKTRDLCALICAYNEEETVQEVVSRTKPFVGEIIVVDDGSRDATAARARMGGGNVLSHPTNYGKGKALRTGFDYFSKTSYSALVTLDADLQHLPEEIPRFLRQLNLGRDIVMGKRDFSLPEVPKHRMLGNTIYAKVLSWASEKNIYDAENGFRAFKREPLLTLYKSIATEGFTYEAEFLLATLKSNYKIGWADITTVYLPGRISKIQPCKHLMQSTKIAWNMVLDRIEKAI